MVDNCEGVLKKIADNGVRGYIQIADAISEMIMQGQLSGGTRLPSTKDMVEILGVSRLTVHRSLTRLSELGLINRRPKLGTFVSTGIFSKTVGLISGEDPMLIASPFYRLLFSAFHQCSREYGFNFNNYFFMGEFDEARTYKTLKDDIDSGKLKYLVIVTGTVSIMKWLDTNCSIPYLVPQAMDLPELIKTGIRSLCIRGCRRIHVLSLYEDSPRFSANIEQERAAMLEAYEGCGSPGEKPKLLVPGQKEQMGYSYMRGAFSSSGDKPDGILINHDMLARGVAMAALELNLRIPEDLKIVTHENKGSELMVPFEMDRIQVDPSQVAACSLSYLREKGGDLSPGMNLCEYGGDFKYICGRDIKEAVHH